MTDTQKIEALTELLKDVIFTLDMKQYEFGMMKLVNREVFAYANFNSGRFQVA